MIIPLIRASCLVPYVKWLESKGRPVDEYLAEAGLCRDPVAAPERAVPLRLVFSFLDTVAVREDLPDLGWRVISDAGLRDLGVFGLLAMAGPTLGDGLRRLESALPKFCTHERFDVEQGDTMRIRFTLPVGPAALHQAHLYSLALACQLAGIVRPGAPYLEAAELQPHPEHGLARMDPTACRSLAPSTAGDLIIRFHPGTFASRLPPETQRTGLTLPVERWGDLGPLSTMPRAADALVRMMLEDGTPSALHLASAAGVNLRTLQRHLASTGTSYTMILQEARRQRALAAIESGDAPLASLAETLGYSSPSGLSRAVRRWTGRPPGKHRRSRS
jgi:AraC-like DNA-binding protein